MIQLPPATFTSYKTPRTMQHYFFFAVTVLLLTTCEPPTPPPADPNASRPARADWTAHRITTPLPDSMTTGMTYLSSYSQVYVQTDSRRFDLTGTVSIRNINLRDTIYLRSARYFNTAGDELRSHFEGTVYVAPMETVEIIIEEADRSGGTGDNFLFAWSVPPGAHEPYFEGVFISTYGQQGISFTTRGVRVE